MDLEDKKRFEKDKKNMEKCLLGGSIFLTFIGVYVGSEVVSPKNEYDLMLSAAIGIIIGGILFVFREDLSEKICSDIYKLSFEDLDEEDF